MLIIWMNLEAYHLACQSVGGNQIENGQFLFKLIMIDNTQNFEKDSCIQILEPQ
jgi:hypothetical protein